MKLFQLLGFFLLISAKAFSIEPVTVEINDKNNADFYSIASKALIIEDKQHLIQFDDLKSNKENIREKFQIIKQDNANLSFTSSTYWAWFKVKNTDSFPKHFMLEVARPLTNVANLFTIDNNGECKVQHNGDELVFSKREVQNRKLLFPVKFQPGEELTFYLQLRSDGEVIILPIRLWKPESLMQRDYNDQYLFGLFYGILLFVFIIYFFFYIALRDKAFLYYVFYVASIMLLQMSLDGLSFQYLWSNNIWWANHVIPLSASLTGIAAVLYAKVFLKIKDNFPRLNKIYALLVFLNIICLFLSLGQGKLFEFAFPFVNFLSLISIILIITTILLAYFKRKKVSIFFTLAFFSLMACVIVFILGNISLLPVNFFSENAIKFGSATEVIFLSLSMANKYREIQQEKEVAQAKALEISLENEKITREQNIVLEQKVTERTYEIVRQKEIIEQKNKDILDSIHYAKRIQRALLASDVVLKRNLPEYFVLYKPKDIVSGDFYWAQVTNNSFLLAVCDCTGHGVPGAFMSLLNISFLNETVVEKKVIQPNLILNRVRDSIINALNAEGNEESKDAMDCVLCNFDFQNMQLRFACSNNPLWIVRNKELIEFKPDKMPVGYHYTVTQSFTLQEFTLQKGDCAYLFSDGYADQFGGQLGKKFKYSQLSQLLLSINAEPLEKQKNILFETIENWRGELDQIDDICIIGVRI